jgi:hypothetical protein
MTSQDPANPRKKNTGKAYEILTQRIFQKIVDQTLVKNVEVKHNVILKGKTAEHQIDVFWEYEIKGRLYRTIIQTKDWSSKVSLGHLLTLKGVLVDLPGRPKGVFVTKTGYQSGASDYAKKNGIVLYELRKPEKSDFAGQIGNLSIEMQLSGCYHFQNLNMKMDEEWVRNEFSKIGYKGHYKFSLSGRYDQMILYDENDSEIGTLYDIIISDVTENSSQEISKKFDNAFIKTPLEKIAKVKISEVTCLITAPTATSNFEIDLDDMVKFILKNVHKNYDITYVFEN